MTIIFFTIGLQYMRIYFNLKNNNGLAQFKYRTDLKLKCKYISVMQTKFRSEGMVSNLDCGCPNNYFQAIINAFSTTLYSTHAIGCVIDMIVSILCKCRCV